MNVLLLEASCAYVFLWYYCWQYLYNNYIVFLWFLIRMKLDIVVWNMNEWVDLSRVLETLQRQQDASTHEMLFMLTAVDRYNLRSKQVDCFEEISHWLNMSKNFYVHEFNELATTLPWWCRWAWKWWWSQWNAIHTTLQDITYTELDIPHTKRMQRDGSTVIPEKIEPRTWSHKAQRISFDHNWVPYSFTHGHLAFWRSSERDRDEQFDALCSWLSEDELLNAFIWWDMNSFWRLSSLRSKRLYYAMWTLDPAARHRMVYAWRKYRLSDPHVQWWDDQIHTIQKIFGLIRAKTDWWFFGRDINSRVTDHNVLTDTWSDHAFLKYTVDLG